MTEQQSQNEIRSRPCPGCYVCGASGKPLYHGLRDLLFGAPGDWNLKKCPSKGCGLIWLDPMPLEEDISKAYESYYTHQGVVRPSDTRIRRIYLLFKEGYLAYKYGYYKGIAPWKKLLGTALYLHPGRRAELDFSVMYLPAPASPGRRLLDVGCGSGEMLKTLQGVGWSVEGVDFDRMAVSNAQNKGLRVRLGTLEDQRFADDCFDAVIMSHLIEHVHEPSQLLHECHRVLKPGGRLVVVTPNGESWGHTMFRSSWRGLEPPRHLHIFNLSSLRILAERAGFQKLGASTTIRDANGLLMASRSIQRAGKHVMGSTQPWTIRAWARGLQLIEWAILKARPYAGEEIALVAEK